MANKKRNQLSLQLSSEVFSMLSLVPLRSRVESALGKNLSSTLLLRERAAPQTVSTGLAVLDALTGGLPRGALSEITGPTSSGRTSVMLAALAEATSREEACALVDASDCFDPASAEKAGVNLECLLWVRCTEQDHSLRKGRRRSTLARLEQVLKVTDLLLQSGGFGMVVLDLGDVPVESARRVPLTSWFRFRRAVEPTSTVLLVVEREPCAKTCASLVVRLRRIAACTCNAVPPVKEMEIHGWKVVGREQPAIPPLNDVGHASLLNGMQLHAEVVRSWPQRKSVQSVGIDFGLRAAW